MPKQYHKIVSKSNAANSSSGKPNAARRRGEACLARTIRGSNPILNPDLSIAMAGNDVLYGFGGGDRLNGLGGDDMLNGGGESDVLYGGKGKDVLYGEDASQMDVIDGDTPAISARNFGHGPSSLLLAQYQSGNQAGIGIKGDWLAGGDGSDDLIGSAGNDVLSGGQGKDNLIGGAGNDILLGDADVVAGYEYAQQHLHAANDENYENQSTRREA